MAASRAFPQEYRIPVLQEHLRTIKDPHLDLTILHALVKVRNLPNGTIPDRINPRSHEATGVTGRIPEAIAESLTDQPEVFHLLNRANGTSL